MLGAGADALLMRGPRRLLHPAFGRHQVGLLELDRPWPENDDTSTAQTVAVMRQLVREDSQAPEIRRIAAAITAGITCPRKELDAIHRAVRERVRFVPDAALAGFSPDPEAAEVLIRPVDLVRMPRPAGDCDDFSMLVAALSRAVGIRGAFKTVAADPESANFSHVYYVALLKDGPVVVDASHGPRAGWETQATGKARLWPIEDGAMLQTALGALGFDWNLFGKIAGQGMDTAGKILIPRYSVPQLNPGQYIQRGSEIYSQQPPGASPLAYPGLNVGGNGTWFILGLGAIAAVVAVNVFGGGHRR